VQQGVRTVNAEWAFDDPPNVAVFTRRSIISGESWIQFVSHDENDGAWQFHPPDAGGAEEDAAVVSLRTITQLDPSVLGLADLPLGWRAWRTDRDSAWQRERVSS
jgi:hypothetical protein